MRLVLWFLAAFACLGGSVLMSQQVGSITAADRTRILVPSPTLVKALVSDFDNALADGYWMLFLQLNGEGLVARSEDEDAPFDFREAYPTLDLLTDLDPRFKEATLFGSWALADAGEVDNARRLIAKAIARYPESYEFPFQLGFIEFLYGKRYVDAAAAFTRAGQLPGAPVACMKLAAAMYAKGNKNDLAIAIWKDMAESASDDQTRRIAERQLKRLEVKGP